MRPLSRIQPLVGSALGAGVVLVLAVHGCGSSNSSSSRERTLETDVPNATVAAGDRVNAHCTLTPEPDEPVALEIVYQHEDHFSTDEDGAVIASRAGTATVRCSAPELGLVDEDPVTLTIVPGPPRRVFTLLDADSEVAGIPVGVSCMAFDAFDNEVLDLAYLVGTSPSGAGVSADAASVTATAAGDYEVSCIVPAAAELETDFLHVRPDLPASIAAAVMPEKTFYSIDDQVKVLPVALDVFGNRVDDVEISYEASPILPSPFEGRFTFDDDGTFVLSASVISQTLGGVALSASVPVLVNSAGPSISCRRADNPGITAQSYMMQVAPGTVVVPVAVSDDFDVASVSVNGVAATFNAGTGNYQAGVPVGFGMNFFDVVATDTLGLENSTTCFMLAAERYTPENNIVAGAVGLRLSPAAIDGPNGQLTSLGSILQTVLQSPQLRTLVDQGLSAANPINDGSCGIIACNPDVNYNAGSVNWNTPDSAVTLINGGLRVVVTIPNFRLNVRACGTACCIGGSTIGITADSLQATVDFSLQLQAGVLRATVVGTPNVTVGNVALNGSGFCGFLVNLVEGFFTGTVRSAVRDALSGFISSDLGPVLDGVVSSLDISQLGQTFSVPRLDGAGTVDLQFGLAMSSLSITTTRALLGIGTRFTAASPAHARPTLGIGHRTATALLDPPGTTAAQPVGLSVYEGTLNHVLHALWRGGFFQANLQLGTDGTAVLDARLPPVVKVLPGNQAELTLGGIGAVVTLPGVISNPVSLTFGGRATAALTLQNGDLVVGNLALTDVYVATETPLSQGQRDALEGFLSTILQDVLVGAINDGLPALPIPSFTLPQSVAGFGLPAGAELGIVNPSLTTVGSHCVLKGGFGVQP
jgi:hypothetical protein